VHPVRLATDADAPEVARLLAQLGMLPDSAPILSRWNAWRAAGNSALVAVRADGTLSGVAILHTMMPLHRPETIGRINALVVDAPDRGHGVGRALVAAAETALAQAGCSLMEITSNNRLVEAHAFYRHLGYEQTSMRFAKNLQI
jgi:GNAT superfamily N-acetyltransferase